MPFDGRLLGGVSVLSAVIDAGSFARAGDALGITASGVSRAIGGSTPYASAVNITMFFGWLAMPAGLALEMNSSG